MEPTHLGSITLTVLDLQKVSTTYELPIYSQMKDLLAKIECEACDMSRFNPESPLSSGDVVVLYPKTDSCVSLNQARLEELDALPGIGPAIAQRIVDFRAAKGFFQTLEEIQLVKGIKQALFDKIKAKICL